MTSLVNWIKGVDISVKEHQSFITDAVGWAYADRVRAVTDDLLSRPDIHFCGDAYLLSQLKPDYIWLKQGRLMWLEKTCKFYCAYSENGGFVLERFMPGASQIVSVAVTPCQLQSQVAAHFRGKKSDPFDAKTLSWFKKMSEKIHKDSITLKEVKASLKTLKPGKKTRKRRADLELKINTQTKALEDLKNTYVKRFDEV